MIKISVFGFMDKDNILTICLRVYLVRGQLIMLDKDLAQLYQVDINVLNKTMLQNKDVFEGHVVHLTKEEVGSAEQELSLEKESPTFAYTRKGSYKMGFVLDTKVALEATDVVLKVFREAEDRNKIIQLERRIDQLENIKN